jgi:hypothetical protein
MNQINALLKFGRGNAKLGREIWTFSLPAGHTCPGARGCLAKVGRDGGLVDGSEQEFRCFSATAESVYSNVRKSRWHNFDLLKGLSKEEMVALILASLPEEAKLVRIHVSGDFYSESYFQAWMEVARRRPFSVFYAYTKSLRVWVKNRGEITANLRLTASYGGKWDSLIKEHGLKSAKVVFSLEEAVMLGLETDHDDSHAYGGEESFALVLHSVQPKGSLAAKSLSALKMAGETGYSRK